MKRQIPILILADCEPDARETVPGVCEPWYGFERFHDFLSSWREIITRKTQTRAHFAWFWRADPQIEVTYGDASWPIRTYARQIEQLEQHGDEFGLHTHPWRWTPGINRWIADFGNSKWIETCVRSSFDIFERHFGAPPRLFRFGDGWLDNATVRLIEKLGAQIDLTLEPGKGAKLSLVKKELTTGLIPDTRQVPNHPYHPSCKDFRSVDSTRRSTLWLMPVSTARKPISDFERFVSFVSDLLMPHRRTLQLNLGLEPDLFQCLFGRSLFAMRHPYVAICVRSDVGSNNGLLNYAGENLSWILRHHLADHFMFVTPMQAITYLTAHPGGSDVLHVSLPG
jgi:hypothetical protein